MSKKPASLTSDLLARKGEAEPSTIDPSARMTLAAGPGFSDEYSGGHHEPEGGDRDDDLGPYADEARHRPMPPEPEIIYTAEETGGGGGSSRLIITAILGLIIIGGIFLVVSGNQPDSVAPVANDIVAQTPEATAENAGHLEAQVPFVSLTLAQATQSEFDGPVHPPEH